jgi:hypothetical protein
MHDLPIEKSQFLKQIHQLNEPYFTNVVKNDKDKKGKKAAIKHFLLNHFANRNTKKIRKYEPKYPYPRWISEDFKSLDDFMDSWSYSQLKYNTKSKTLTSDVIRHEYVVRRRDL